MSGLQILRVALRALLRNKLRSFLTTLGIIIGVAAVIAMVTFGEGAKAQVESSFSSLGANMLVILSGASTAGGVHGGFGSMPTLTYGDLHAIQTEAPAVRYAVPILRSVVQVFSEDQNWTTSVEGTGVGYFGIRDWPAAAGSLFTRSDVEGGAKVALLGQTVSDKLFGAGINPVGRMVRIKNIPFQVIGLLAKKGQSPIGQDYDDAVYVPYTTFRSRIQQGLGQFVGGAILASADSAQDTVVAQREITAILRDRHHLQPGMDDDFSVRNLSELIGALEAGTRTLTTLLASIAAVSLLVGGIGIMNIMLVSVTERTREIGVRMAVGARPRDILLQFLTEASALAVAGGIVGVGLGLGAAAQLSGRFGWPLVLRPDIILIAVVFSGLVGVAFGLVPARKAARLDPIEALRFE